MLIEPTFLTLTFIVKVLKPPVTYITNSFESFYFLSPVNVPATVVEAMTRQESLQSFSKNGKPSSSSSSSPPSTSLMRSMVFPHSPCPRTFSLLDKVGIGIQSDSSFSQLASKNQRVLASPTSTSQLSSEFSDWHLWKCGQCFKTFTQRILLQMHVCPQNPDR